MKITLAYLITAVFLLSVPSNGYCQLVSDTFCKKVEDLVATPLKPAHWYHNIVFDNECSLEFDLDHEDGIGISFDLERFVNEMDARKSFQSDKEMLDDVDRLQELRAGKKKPKPFYFTQGFWDAALFYDYHGPIMLRKGKSVVTIFCDQRMRCVDLERKLKANRDFFDF